MATPRTAPEVAVAEVRAAGYEPLEPYPGRTVDPWNALCPECGCRWALTLQRIRSGHRCQHTRYTQDAARKRLAAQGYEPAEPYPGDNQQRWRVRCVRCKRRTRCAPMVVLRRAVPCPCAEHASQAEADIRAAGYIPLAPYPGNTRDPWSARCTTCGVERMPNVDTIRSGKRCKHLDARGNPITPPADGDN
jgi:hypothetical protein